MIHLRASQKPPIVTCSSSATEEQTCWASVPELGFIVAVIRSVISGRTDPTVARWLETGLNWQNLVTLGLEQKILPLLAAGATGICSFAFPVSLQAALRTYASNLDETNHRKICALADALATLQSDGITGLSFKGFTLTNQAYGSGLTRDVNDLDVLVPPGGFTDALRVFTNQGYTIDRRHAKAVEVHVFFPADLDDLVLDVHCGFAGPQFPAPHDIDGFLERAVTIEIGEHRVRTLDPADHLIVLSINLIKQFVMNEPTLRNLADIAALAKAGGEATVQSAIDRAAEQGLKAVILIALANATALFGPTSSALEHGPGMERYLFVYDRRYVRDCATPAISPFSIWRWPLLWHVHVRWRDKITRGIGRHLTWMAKTVFSVTENDVAFVKLPSSCRFLYPIIRPVRLLLVTAQRVRDRHDDSA